MRPIWMKIKGLNSFLEAQEIDFTKLTSQGLFGIFGPTGSGKSTILDGITIALYGTTSRNSSNFIHVNTDRASVDYIFSVREKQEHIYRVSRSFKRSKEGSIRSVGAKFMELKGEEQEILAERAVAVNAKCKEVIGLSKEVFFRTVVLPQGKFSEFLKLEGMERNKMLERLFHLEKYGEELVEVIKSCEAGWQGKKKEKEGALSRYAQVDSKLIEELKSLEKECAVLLEKKQEEIRETRKNLEEGRKIFQYQTELEELKEQADKLEQQRQHIAVIQEELLQAQKANLLWGYLKDFREAEAAWKEHQEKTVRISGSWEQKQEEAESRKAKKEQAENCLQIQKPGLELLKARLEDAIAFAQEKQKQEAEKQMRQAEAEAVEKQLKDYLGKMETLEESIGKLQKSQEEVSRQLQEATVPVDIQRAAEEGFHLSRELLKNRKKQEELADKISSWEAEEKKAARTQKLLQKQEEEALAFDRKQEEERKRLKEQQEAIGSLEKEKEQISSVRAEKEKERLLLEAIKEQQKICSEMAEDLEIARKEKEDRLQEKEEAEKFYRENLAAILAKDLQEGEHCPVCGSVHHEKVYEERDQEKLEVIEKRKEQADQAFQKDSVDLARRETKYAGEQEQLQKLFKEREQLKQELLELNQEALEKAFEEKEKEKERLEKQLEKVDGDRQKLREEIYKLQARQAKCEAEKENYEKRTEEGKEELKELGEEIKSKEQMLAQLSKTLQTEDFPAVYGDIQKKSKMREQKQARLQELVKGLDARRKNKEKGDSLIQEQKTKKAQLELVLEQLRESILKLEKQILEKAGQTENLDKKKQEVSRQIQHMEEKYAEETKLWETVSREANQLQQEKSAMEALTKSSQETAEKKNRILREKMEEADVEDERWIGRFRKEEEEMQHCREEAERFKEAVVTVKTQIDRVQKQLDQRKISREELQELETKVADLEQDITEKNKQLGAARKELEQMENAWKEKELLKKELEEIYHKLDILSQLSGLFWGKKFVEYVSRYYLEYVSREANERLKEMTGNGYGLETDQNGLFLIRDYKNGGISRSASTLSGGETFMASLALALALSSQIQMKGAAPLELFFLDEGFGTLDENYLQVVMESLEKIRNKRRSVGVISHVEEIKNRIPMRLIVEPAAVGEGGSKVHIEQA